MEAKLVLLSEDGHSGEYKLKLPIIMGRSRQAGLTVLHSSVSRQHCELSEYEGQLVAHDLGSLNGTFIEETRITEPTILPDGGLLRVGSVNFQAVYGSSHDLMPPTVSTPQNQVLSATEQTLSNSAAADLMQPGDEPAEHEPELELQEISDEADEFAFLEDPPVTEELSPVAPAKTPSKKSPLGKAPAQAPTPPEEPEPLELMLDDETPPDQEGLDPFEFLAAEEAPPAEPVVVPAKTPAQPGKKGAAPAPKPAVVAKPAVASKHAPAAPKAKNPVAPQAPAAPAADKSPAAPQAETLRFLPPVAEPEGGGDEPLAEDLDAFFKSLQ